MRVKKKLLKGSTDIVFRGGREGEKESERGG
jgi:hypothetical protein